MITIDCKIENYAVLKEWLDWLHQTYVVGLKLDDDEGYPHLSGFDRVSLMFCEKGMNENMSIKDYDYLLKYLL